MEKNIVSNILKEKRDWKSLDDSIFPKIKDPVIIRIVNDSIKYGETDTEIYPAEDIKIAYFLPPMEFSKSDQLKNDPLWWRIFPPFPLYDYSPLTNKEILKKGSYVSHWAIPEKGELDGWKTRFDSIHAYEKLNIEVDEKHRETVYRALMYGALYISECSGEDYKKEKPGTGMKLLYETLCDLQSCMDKTYNNESEALCLG